jgi:hypothetical protein
MKYEIVGKNPYIKMITTVCPFMKEYFVGGFYCINQCEYFTYIDNVNQIIGCKQSRENKLKRILNDK